MTESRRCPQCGGTKSGYVSYENDWDQYIKKFQCDLCGHYWLVGELKRPARNPVLDEFSLMLGVKQSD